MPQQNMVPTQTSKSETVSRPWSHQSCKIFFFSATNSVVSPSTFISFAGVRKLTTPSWWFKGRVLGIPRFLVSYKLYFFLTHSYFHQIVPLIMINSVVFWPPNSFSPSVRSWQRMFGWYMYFLVASAWINELLRRGNYGRRFCIASKSALNPPALF